MQTITTIGLDIAKSVFQVHGVDTGGQVVMPFEGKRVEQRFLIDPPLAHHGRRSRLFA